MKLSGKRTATTYDPGKIRTLGLDTEGESPSPMLGIISQVKRQEEGKGTLIAFLFFFGGTGDLPDDHGQGRPSWSGC